MVVGGAEEHFAKKLANNDKTIRDRAVKRLRAWIASRPSTGTGFSEIELLKIWKGLFYCFWMSDKPLIQEELAENISKLQHSFKNKESGFSFIMTFFKTMQKEWHGIDRLRMDKFYLLVRMFIKENFEFLKTNSWDPSICSRLFDIYKDGPLHPSKENVPDGIKLHLCGVFLTELSNVADEKVSAEIISSLFEPFFILAAETKSQVVSRAVKDGVLEKLLEMEEIRLRKEDPDEDDEEDDNKEEKEKMLQINCQAVADKLFSLGSDRQILGRNRKLLYLYSKKFKRFVSDDAEENDKGRKRKLGQEKESEELPHVPDIPVKKTKKKKQEKQSLPVNGTVDGEEVHDVENEPEVKQKDGKKKKRKRSRKENEQEVSAKEVPLTPKIKKQSKEMLSINGNTEDDIISTESNGLQEVETAQEKGTGSVETDVEKTIKELRNQVSSAQNTEKTPVKKKKKQDVQGGETPFASFTKTATPPAFFKKALSRTEPRKAKTTKLTCPNTDPQNSKKKVRIHLHKNKAQSTSDYVKSVSSSPDIPFDASRTPEFGLLKSKSLTSSKRVKAAKKHTPTKRSKAVDFF